MANYKLYYLDEWQHVLRRIDLDHSNDLAACSAAVAIDYQSVIEVWDGARRVARVHPNRRQTDWFPPAPPIVHPRHL